MSVHGSRWRAQLLALAIVPALVACVDIVDEGWPCGDGRPCEPGWNCLSGACVKSDSICMPSCGQETCGGPDGCGGICSCPGDLPPETAVPKKVVSAPGQDPVGLAFDGSGLWCGDGELGVARKLDPDSGAVLETADLPEATLVDLTMLNGSLMALTDGNELYQLPTFTQPVQRGDLPVSTGIAFDGEYLLSAEPPHLARRLVSNFSVFFTTLLSSGCEFLALHDDYAYQYCDTTGSPGDYRHVIEVYDLANNIEATLEGSFEVAFDASEITGIEVGEFNGQRTLWVSGIGYGSQAGSIGRFRLE